MLGKAEERVLLGGVSGENVLWPVGWWVWTGWNVDESLKGGGKGVKWHRKQRPHQECGSKSARTFVDAARWS